MAIVSSIMDQFLLVSATFKTKKKIVLVLEPVTSSSHDTVSSMAYSCRVSDKPAALNLFNTQWQTHKVSAFIYELHRHPNNYMFSALTLKAGMSVLDLSLHLLTPSWVFEEWIKQLTDSPKKLVLK